MHDKFGHSSLGGVAYLQQSQATRIFSSHCSQLSRCTSGHSARRCLYSPILGMCDRLELSPSGLQSGLRLVTHLVCITDSIHQEILLCITCDQEHGYNYHLVIAYVFMACNLYGQSNCVMAPRKFGHVDRSPVRHGVVGLLRFLLGSLFRIASRIFPIQPREINSPPIPPGPSQLPLVFAVYLSLLG